MPLKGDLDDQDEFGSGEYPHIHELPPEQRAVLQAIKTPQDIKECMVMNTWYDDHQLCVGAVLNGVEFGAWWVGWELTGALYFSDSAKAGPIIVEYLKSQFDYMSDEAAEHGVVEGIDPDEITEEDLPR